VCKVDKRQVFKGLIRNFWITHPIVRLYITIFKLHRQVEFGNRVNSCFLTNFNILTVDSAATYIPTILGITNYSCFPRSYYYFDFVGRYLSGGRYYQFPQCNIKPVYKR
jgi:hypothetical protein